jgi:hypothetical protein
MRCFRAAFVLLLCVGCNKPGASIYSWAPKVDMLEDSESKFPQIKGITKDVAAFYLDLHEKRWEETYFYRNKSFRDLVSMQVYLNNVTNSPGWELLNYQIVNVQANISDNTVTLICKFVESPMQVESFNTITWKVEDGKWRCDAAGPVGLALFAKMTE